jgi:hypothetical protein
VIPSCLSPSASEIAAVAYRLWMERGCPIGSDREDWFRAEVMLNSAQVVKFEDPFERPSNPCCDPPTELEMLPEFRWEGHWEIWEREWVSPHWVWDRPRPRVGALNRESSSRQAA